MTLRHALLAGLQLEPRSGYDLTRWFAEAAGNYWAASHSSIYPELAALEREGLVSHTRQPSARGPARKVYRVTSRGRSTLLEWVDAPAADMQVRDEQLIKALCYGLLPRERALAHLEEASARYQEKLARYEAIARLLESGPSENYGRTPASRLGALLTVRCGIEVLRGYLNWCHQAADLIRNADPRDEHTQSDAAG